MTRCLDCLIIETNLDMVKLLVLEETFTQVKTALLQSLIGTAWHGATLVKAEDEGFTLRRVLSLPSLCESVEFTLEKLSAEFGIKLALFDREVFHF